MVIFGFGMFLIRLIYGLRVRVQRDRLCVLLIEFNFGDSDKESDYDEDEVNIFDEESDYLSLSEDESGEDDVDVVEDDDIESIEVEGEVVGSFKIGNIFQNVRWRKWQFVGYDVVFKGEFFFLLLFKDKIFL